MKQIIYLSTAQSLMTQDNLLNILDVARKRNSENSVTGVLLYSGGTFIQVLEGPAENVDEIYSSIERDKRHKQIIKLIAGAITKRTFEDWSMGFASPSPEKMAEFSGYINSTDEFLTNSGDSTSALMIKTFITTNNLVVG